MGKPETTDFFPAITLVTAVGYLEHQIFLGKPRKQNYLENQIFLGKPRIKTIWKTRFSWKTKKPVIWNTGFFLENQEKKTIGKTRFFLENQETSHLEHQIFLGKPRKENYLENQIFLENQETIHLENQIFLGKPRNHSSGTPDFSWKTKNTTPSGTPDFFLENQEHQTLWNTRFFLGKPGEQNFKKVVFDQDRTSNRPHSIHTITTLHYKQPLIQHTNIQV